MLRQKPITVEVLAYAPVAFFHCLHCEFVWQQTGTGANYRREQSESSLPGDLKQEYQELSDWVRSVVGAHGQQLHFKIIDAASVEGWIKSLRYRVREYPAVIVAGKQKATGPDWRRAAALVRCELQASSG